MRDESRREPTPRWYSILVPVVLLAVFAWVTYRSLPTRLAYTTLEDYSVDLVWAQQQLTHGIEWHGHFSRTLDSFHPGPLYLWILVVATWLSNLTGWFTPELGGYYLLTYSAVLFSAAAVFTLTKASRKPAVGYGVAIALAIAQYPTASDAQHYSSARIGGWLWAPYLMPWVMLLLLCTAVTLALQWRWAPAWASAAALLASQVYLVYAVIAVPVFFFAAFAAYKNRTDRRARLAYLSSGIFAIPYLVRLVTEGPLFWVPRRYSLDGSTRFDYSAPGFHFENGLQSLQLHSGLPGLVALVLALAALVLFLVFGVRRQEHRRVLFTLAAILALGVLQILFLYPSPLQNYQTNWTEPAWQALVGGSVALAAYRFRPSRIALPFIASLALLGMLVFSHNYDPARSISQNNDYQSAISAVKQRAGEMPVRVMDGRGLPGTIVVLTRTLRAMGVDACHTNVQRDIAPMICPSEFVGATLTVTNRTQGVMTRGEVIATTRVQRNGEQEEFVFGFAVQ